MGILTDFKMPSIEKLSQKSGEFFSVHAIITERAAVVSVAAELVPRAVESMSGVADSIGNVAGDSEVLFQSVNIDKPYKDTIKNGGEPETESSNRIGMLLEAKQRLEALQTEQLRNGVAARNSGFLDIENHGSIANNPAEAQIIV